MGIKYISLDVLSIRLHLPQQYLRGLVETKSIPYLKVGTRIRFEEGQVRDALEQIAKGNHGQRKKRQLLGVTG